MILRIAGYGYPTSFFLQMQMGNQSVFVENEKFGLRFFPPALARSPSPVMLAAEKPAGTYRIFLFGESAALGDPRPAYGVGRYLEVLLRERFPGTHFEVVCVAMTAINSHAILPMARECARHEGDLWILYMGNNEMEGPFGAGTVFGPETPSLVVIRAGLALKTTRTGQLLAALEQKLQGKASVRTSWAGLRMFQEHQVQPQDPRKQIIYKHFQKNLEDIVRVGRDAGVSIILSTVASNLKDCAPFGSVHTANLSNADRSNWDKLFQLGTAMESRTNFQEALAFYAQAAAIDARFAELPFREGRCFFILTNYDEARQSFERARDCDSLPFRADSELNAIIERIAARHADGGVYQLNAEDALSRQCPGGIPGNEVFYEHVHLNLEGNYALARAFGEAVERLLPQAITQHRRQSWSSRQTCEQQLGLTDWNRQAVYAGLLQRISDAPFTNQLNHLAQVQALRNKLTEIKSRTHPSAYMDARLIYEEALKKAPQDFRLHENYAECLEANGDWAEAVAEWQKVRELRPHHFLPCFQMGKALARQGKYAEAQEYLAKSLRLRPDYADALLESGKVLVKQGKPDQAMIRYVEARRLRPEEASIHLDIANALAVLNKRAEAMESLREAIRLRPSFWEARFLLGVELAVNEKIKEAQAEFEAVTRLRPNFARAHLNLAVALAKQGRTDEARVHFRETLRLDPDNKKAQQYLKDLESVTNERPGEGQSPIP